MIIQNLQAFTYRVAVKRGFAKINNNINQIAEGNVNIVEKANRFQIF